MSGLRSMVEDYLAIRRALGFTLRAPAVLLEHFLRFAEQDHAEFITTDLAMRFVMQPGKAGPVTRGVRLRTVRLLAGYCATRDPRTEVPSRDLLPSQYRRQQPYIYTDEEIASLLVVAVRLPSRTGLRAATYTTLYGLLAVTGFRISEAVDLDRRDVDLEQGLITVRRTKFGKTRWVPLHATTVTALREYGSRRDEIHPSPRTSHFFLSEDGAPITQCMARWTFVRLSRELGLRQPGDSHGPRLHDFRHRFAVATLLAWYREGKNVERLLPVLSTYLGHVHVNDTYWYLTAVPELLALASARTPSKEVQL